MDDMIKIAVYTQNAQSLAGRLVNGIDPDDLDPECADYSIFEGTSDELSALADSYEALGNQNVSGYAAYWFRIADSIRSQLLWID